MISRIVRAMFIFGVLFLAVPPSSGQGLKQLKVLKGHDELTARVVFSSDGKQLFSTGWDGLVRQWDVATGKEGAPIYKEPARWDVLQLSSDGQVMLIATTNKFTVIDVPGRKALMKHAGGVDSRMALSRDGKGVIGMTPEGTNVWEVASGKVIHAFPRGGFPAVSPAGKLLATIDSKDVAVKIYDLESRQAVATLKEIPKSVIDSLLFTSDSKMVVLIAAGEVRTWDVTTGKMLADLKGLLFASATLDPAKKTLLLVSYQKPEFRFHDPATGKLLRQIPLSDGFWRLVFAPDGKTIAGIMRNPPFKSAIPKESIVLWQMPVK